MYCMKNKKCKKIDSKIFVSYYHVPMSSSNEVVLLSCDPRLAASASRQGGTSRERPTCHLGKAAPHLSMKAVAGLTGQGQTHQGPPFFPRRFT